VTGTRSRSREMKKVCRTKERSREQTAGEKIPKVPGFFA